MTHRLTLAQIMALVAVVAIAFATAPASIAVVFSLILCVAAGLAASFRMSWSRLACRVFACYPLLPLLSLYATWATAWYCLGHLPRSSLDDPKFISPMVDVPYDATSALLAGALPALVVHALLVAIDFLRMMHDERDDLKRFMVRGVLPLLSWPIAYFGLMADPGGVFGWFCD